MPSNFIISNCMYIYNVYIYAYIPACVDQCVYIHVGESNARLAHDMLVCTHVYVLATMSMLLGRNVVLKSVPCSTHTHTHVFRCSTE